MRPTHPRPDSSVAAELARATARLVQQGAKMLTPEESAAIFDTHDAHGCVLIPKDDTPTDES